MSEPSRNFSAPGPLVALCGWLLPGAGYFLIGQKIRGVVIGITILAIFMGGILIAGIRVIDVPGFDNRGRASYVRYEQDSRGHVREIKSLDPAQEPPNNGWQPTSDWRWVLRVHPFPEIADKPWFVGQILTGPICLAAASRSVAVSRPAVDDPTESATPPSHARIFEIGTLYTAVAGMLNLLAIIDASYRAGQGAG